MTDDDKQFRHAIIVDAMVKARPESAWRRGYDTQYLRRREAILARKPMCAICGKRQATEIDHVQPLIRGGKNGRLRAVCRQCNAKNGGGERRVSKASFGGDRSAAGRYAAEQRWKGHTPNQSPRDFREVLTNLKTVEQKFKERVREQARGMSDEELQREYDSLDWVAESNLDDAMYGKYRRETLGEEIRERRTERVRQGIVETVKREGGMSVKIESGDQPVDGFMVARKENSVIVSADDFFDETEGKRIMSDFLKENRARFGKEQFLGIWHNKKNGKVYLDITDNIKDRSEAERLGKERNQISIWDVVNGAEVDTGGTGEG